MKKLATGSYAPEKHQGYAFQWFSLALAWLSLMIWAGYKNRVKEV